MRITPCLICYDPNTRTQKKDLLETGVTFSCPLCKGTGSLEVLFQEGLSEDEIRLIGQKGMSGHFQIGMAIPRGVH